MCAELGGFSGRFARDDETVRFLRERRGIEFALEPWMRGGERDAGPMRSLSELISANP